MGFYKDLYIVQFEKELAELEAEGVPTDKAYQLAAARAYSGFRDLLADKADRPKEDE